MHPGIPHGLLRLSGFRELRPQPGPPLLVITYPYPPTLPCLCVLQRSHTKVRISRQGVMLHRCLSPILFFSSLFIMMCALSSSRDSTSPILAQELTGPRNGSLIGFAVFDGGPTPMASCTEPPWPVISGTNWKGDRRPLRGQREKREGPRVKKNSAHSLRYHPQPQKTKIPCPQKSPSKRVSFTAAQCSPSLFIF